MNKIYYRIEPSAIYVVIDSGEEFSAIIEVADTADEYSDALASALIEDQSPTWLIF
jgi:hypothetical protein